MLLRVNNLKTHLGTADQPVCAVDCVSLNIQAGETFVLVGESGCGKSMLSLSLMRLLPPGGRIVGGNVELEGESLLGLSEAEMRRVRGGQVGMIFQEPMTSLNPVMTVGNQVAEAVRLHDRQQAKQPAKRVVELFKAVGIPDPERRMQEYPHQLSGGMKQRVMISMALAGRPKLLIADEPTTALDVTIQAQVLDLLKRLQRETGMAILLITHDLGVVAEMADRVGVMYAGQMVETATAQDFFRQPRHPYSQKLFRSLPHIAKRSQRLDVIPGMVPTLDQTFTHCRFIARCEQVQSICQTGLPPWQGGENAGYRCYLSATQAVLRETAPIAVTEPVGDTSPLLEVKNLRMHFPIRRGVFRRTVGYVKAVDGVDLLIHKGQTLALVGESGCGKTTVGKAILQLPKPTAGEVWYEKQDLLKLRGNKRQLFRQHMQMIFQDPAASMNPRMLVESIMAEGMCAQGLGGTQPTRRQRIADLLQQVGLPEGAMWRYPHEFSGGQRQRIAIARALAVQPELLICDEPTSALDVSVQAQVLNLLKQLQVDLQLSYLFITHNIAVVAYLADEVAVMYLGRIVEQGRVAQILQHAQHPYTRALLEAVPVPHPTKKKQVLHLQGDLPSPANPPKGCHFHARCPQVMPKCRATYPPMVPYETGHQVACWLV